MKPDVFVLLMLCIYRQTADCSLPNFTPATLPLQSEVLLSSESSLVPSLTRARFSRLPGLCRRLKRRRVTVLCNLEKLCWSGQGHRDRAGQVCRCPRGSRCSQVFIHSL